MKQAGRVIYDADFPQFADLYREAGIPYVAASINTDLRLFSGQDVVIDYETEGIDVTVADDSLRDALRVDHDLRESLALEQTLESVEGVRVEKVETDSYDGQHDHPKSSDVDHDTRTLEESIGEDVRPVII